MLGKKKKKEKQAGSQENNLDKPQTLAELDAMAREKKRDDDTTEQEDETSHVIEHEVSHNDEHTVDTNVKTVTSSQKKLIAIVGFASILLIFGGTMFYSQIEDDGGVAIGTGGSGSQEIPDPANPESEDLLPRGTYAYVAKQGETSYSRKNLGDDSTGDIDIGATVSKSKSPSPSFQLSSDSLVSATYTSQGIVVKKLEETNTILDGQASRIDEWILIPDGTRIFAIIGNDLHGFDASSGEGGVVAESFIPAGSQRSRLIYARDGSVQIYAKSGATLRGSIYSLSTQEVSPLELEIERLANVGSFSDGSISPDGTSAVFEYTTGGNQTLQLLSLNSRVLRTIYLADAGNSITSFKWSDDSTNLAVYESGSSPKINRLKVGTLEKEAMQERVSSASSLSWSPNKDYISYVSGNSLKAIKLDDKTVVDVMSGVSADDITGWFAN